MEPKTLPPLRVPPNEPSTGQGTDAQKSPVSVRKHCALPGSHSGRGKGSGVECDIALAAGGFWRAGSGNDWYAYGHPLALPVLTVQAGIRPPDVSYFPALSCIRQ